MYFFLTLYSATNISFISSKKSPNIWILSSSIGEHEEANFLLNFFANYLVSISILLKKY